MKHYSMVFDQGTTSCRCFLFDKSGSIIGRAQKEFSQHYPSPGFVEHDAMEIWSTQTGVALEAMLMANATHEDILAIGITNQRETVVVWDKQTGLPVCPAIVWQCRRTADMCEKLKEDGYSDFFKAKTGLLIDSYFSATKLKYILDTLPDARERAKKGELLFGTIDTWLIWKLTGGKSHVTDYSNASRTMLFNINTLMWDEDILKLLDIPKEMLPRALPSACCFGSTEASIFGGAIPIAGVAGDQQSALFGQHCFFEGELKNTYGTGGFLLMNTGDKPVFSSGGLLTTIAWGIGGKVCYALEGSIFVAGAAVQWLRDELGLIRTAAECEELALSVESSNGVYVVPAFVGLGAPYWSFAARGTIFGLTRGTNSRHVIRATLESIAYQTCDVINLMRDTAAVDIPALRVDGGASQNDFLMQFQADMLNVPVIRPDNVESTALGAHYLAMLGIGEYETTDDISSTAPPCHRFLPSLEETKRKELASGWKRAIKATLAWSEDI